MVTPRSHPPVGAVLGCCALVLVLALAHPVDAGTAVRDSALRGAASPRFGGFGGKVINYLTDAGAIPDASDVDTAWTNGRILNATLANLEEGDTFLLPNRTFHVMGGIYATGLKRVTLQFDGTLKFTTHIKDWPRRANNSVHECINLDKVEDVTITSSGKGTVDGSGSVWWGIPFVGYLIRVENRPRLLRIVRSRNVVVEHLRLVNSPYWTFLADNVDGLIVRHSEVDVRRTKKDNHSLLDLSALNTDGFDVTGKNVHMHDLDIWNQDDCIAVKDGSENMLFERIRASGLGLTIGSIGGTAVRNITIRDCYMDKPVKGIYMKFRESDDPGLISDILYENIVINKPTQFAIWIGPAQQSEKNYNNQPSGASLCGAHPCSLCWPTVPFTKCNAPLTGTYSGITLRNITVIEPKMSPGVIMGHPKNPIRGLVFDGVKVIGGGSRPWGKKHYKCEGVEAGVAKGGTTPVPPCFTVTEGPAARTTTVPAVMA